MKKWIWYQESLPCKLVIKSIAKDFRLQNLKKWTLQENEEKYDVVKQSKKMTKMNPKKDRLIRLHNVILCFRISVIVFRIYNWKKFQICLIFCVFFSNLVFSKCYFLHAGKNISRMPWSTWNFQADLSTLSTIQCVDKI